MNQHIAAVSGSQVAHSHAHVRASARTYSSMIAETLAELRDTTDQENLGCRPPRAPRSPQGAKGHTVSRQPRAGVSTGTGVGGWAHCHHHQLAHRRQAGVSRSQRQASASASASVSAAIRAGETPHTKFVLGSTVGQRSGAG